MVKAIHEAGSAIGQVNYALTEKQVKGKDFCRLLYFVENVKVGDIVTNKNVKSIRPGFGMLPKYLNEIIGKKFNSNYELGTRMHFDSVDL